MARAARMAISTARLLRNGSVPGRPRQIGQTLEFGESPKRVEQPQKIFVLVRSWTWTSRPMTGSYLARSSGEMADSVANFVMGKEIKYSRGAREDARGGEPIGKKEGGVKPPLHTIQFTRGPNLVPGELPGTNARQVRRCRKRGWRRERRRQGCCQRTAGPRCSKRRGQRECAGR